MKITDKYVFFWGGIFSNWANVPEGILYTDPETAECLKFSTSEQLFMYLKAKHFGDMEVADKILKSESPKEAKALGRKVTGFSEEEWEKVREEKMRTALVFKLISWPFFKTELLSDKYSGKTFVEASPYDTIWGIGLREEDLGIEDETTWRGINLLGKILTSLRDDLV